MNKLIIYRYFFIEKEVDYIIRFAKESGCDILETQLLVDNTYILKNCKKYAKLGFINYF